MDLLKKLNIEQITSLTKLTLHNWFGEICPDFQKQLPEYTGMSYEAFREYFAYMSQISTQDLHSLKANLKNSYYSCQPSSVLFIGASTIPITPLVEVLYSLFSQASIECRVPSSVSIEFYNYFHQRLPSELKEFVNYTFWKSDDLEITRQKLKENDFVIVHGSDETIDELSKQFLSSSSKEVHAGKGNSERKLFGFGHKASFSVLDLQKNRLKEQIQKITKDIIAFNQLGCMSPQCIFLINSSKDSLDNFCQDLARELDEQKIYINPSSFVSKHSFLERISLEEECKIYGDSVILSQDSQLNSFNYSCGCKTIWVKPLNKLKDLPRLVAELDGRIACIGHNLSACDGDFLKNLFPKARICANGTMQIPEIDWIQEATHIFNQFDKTL